MAFEIKQGDTRPRFVVILKDDVEGTPAPVNLTGATSAKFLMRAANGGAVKVNAVATISNAAAGEVTYTWAATDTDTVGAFEAEVEITWADGGKETFPSKGYFAINVNDDVG